MRFAITSLWKYKRTYSALFIQLIISFSLVIFGMSLYNQTYKSINTIKKEFPANCLNLVFNSPESAKTAVQDGKLSGRIYQWTYGNKIRLKQEDAITQQVWTDLICVENGFFPVQLGRNLQSDDIGKEDVWPLLVGRSLTDIFPLNKETSVPAVQSDGSKKLQKVVAVGILKEKQILLPFGNIDELSLFPSEKIIVGLLPKGDKINRSNFYVELQKGSNLPNDIGLNSQESVDDITNRILLRNQEFRTACAVVAGLLLLLTCLGMIGSMISISLLRIKEYGIRIAMGATQKMLLLTAGLEVLILCLSSWTIAILIMLPLLSINKMNFDTSWMTIGGSALITFVVALLTGILPLRQLSKMEPIRIVTGRG